MTDRPHNCACCQRRVNVTAVQVGPVSFRITTCARAVHSGGDPDDTDRETSIVRI